MFNNKINKINSSLVFKASQELNKIGIKGLCSLTAKLYDYHVNVCGSPSDWQKKIGEARQKKDLQAIKAFDALKNFSFQKIWGNVVVNKYSGKGILIFGDEGAGKSRVSLSLISSEKSNWKKASPNSPYFLGADDTVAAIWHEGQLLAGDYPYHHSIESICLEYRNMHNIMIFTEIEPVKGFFEVNMAVFLNTFGITLGLKDILKVGGYRGLCFSEPCGMLIPTFIRTDATSDFISQLKALPSKQFFTAGLSKEGYSLLAKEIMKIHVQL